MEILSERGLMASVENLLTHKVGAIQCAWQVLKVAMLSEILKVFFLRNSR